MFWKEVSPRSNICGFSVVLRKTVCLFPMCVRWKANAEPLVVSRRCTMEPTKGTTNVSIPLRNVFFVVSPLDARPISFVFSHTNMVDIVVKGTASWFSVQPNVIVWV